LVERPQVHLVPPEPALSDGVVTLRPWVEQDVPALARAIDGDEEITSWLDMIPQPYTEADAAAYIGAACAQWRDGAHAAFAVTDAGDGELLGSVGLRVVDAADRIGEIGYWTAAAARGRGATTRAVRLVATWAIREHGFERVQLRADVLNVASCRVAEKAGFTREGVIRSAHWTPRQRRRFDWAMYSLLPGEL
jgi:RimJ/RimL family protein N-acetyltransferase